MSGRIIVGVDGSDGGRRALAWAVRHAALAGSRLLVVSVYFDQAHRHEHIPTARVRWARQDAERQLQEDLDAVLESVPVRPEIETRTVPGDGTAAALAELTSEGDVLVVGSHGHSLAAQRLLGTVSMGCVARARCPVLIVPASDRVKHHAQSAAPFVEIHPIPYY
jgi:nucleotide-binding universal stress UspA family protein